MRYLKLFENFDSIELDPKNLLFYMFDIPEPFSKSPHYMLSVYLYKFGEIRPVFYKTDLSELEDFSVVYNIHAEGGETLGVYIVHNDWVENPFISSDDFDIAFTIKDYNQTKKNKNLTKDYDFYEELEKYKNEPITHYDFYIKNRKRQLKTKWTVITYDDKPIALVSEEDSWRIPDQMDLSSAGDWRLLDLRTRERARYEKFRVRSLEEGLEYLKV